MSFSSEAIPLIEPQCSMWKAATISADAHCLSQGIFSQQRIKH